MKVAVLGYGKQGVSAHEYWKGLGNEVTICDSNEKLKVPKGSTALLGKDYLKNLNEFDLIVRSPSVHPQEIIDHNPKYPDILEKVTTNTNEFLSISPSKNIIGVTGTKGKGTTSSLIARMLETAGHKVHLGGNIGTPPLELMKEDIFPPDWVILELANFQLIDLKKSPHLAVCLMVEHEHLDWHPHPDEYIASKQQLFRWQKAQDVAVYYSNSELSRKVVSVSPARKLAYFSQTGAHVKDGKIVIDGKEICSVNDIKLPGEHNWQNVCAAVTAVWEVAPKTEAIRSAVQNFSGLPFRLEFIRETGGIKFYNDSFGTTPETAIVALKAFTEPKIIILGGSDKGADYRELAKAVSENNVKAVIVIGKTGSRIAGRLREKGFENIIDGGSSMAEIVKQARAHAAPGDIVLLSTASASFDMFKNYEDRGQQFNQAVQALA